MIDLHSHILPGIDDGAPDLSTALEMARASVADGVTALACTPHILPGLYHNAGPDIRQRARALQQALDDHGIPLTLTTGADIHIVPDLVAGLQSGRMLTLADSRYVLVEPPSHVVPKGLEELLFGLQVAGYVPVVTHPERLSWVKSHYAMIQQLVRSGIWMQITAGSVTGAFGRTAQYWAHRMLDDGCAHLLATDTHDVSRRPPILGEGRRQAAARVGAVEAEHLVMTRPLGVLNDEPPGNMPAPVGQSREVILAQIEARPSHVRRPGETRPIADAGADRGHDKQRISDRLRRFFG